MGLQNAFILSLEALNPNTLPSSYDNFVETLLYGRESLTLEDVLSSLNSRELKKRTDGKDDGDGLYVRGRSDHRGNQGRGSSRSKSKGQGSDMHSEGYDNGDLLMAVSEERFLEWIIDSGGSFHMTPKRDFLFDFKEFNSGTVLLDDNRACAIMGTTKVRVQMKDGSSFLLENMRYILELKRNLISLGTLDREGYIVKLQNGRVKVINGSLMVLSGTIKQNYMYSLDVWAESGEASVGIQEKESIAQVWHKHLGHIIEVGLHELERRDVLGNKGLEATVKTTYLINRSPSTTLEKKTPMDLWSGHPVNYEMLRIFGCVAYSHVNQGKLKPRAIKCIFLGYPDGVKGYRLWRLDDVKPKIIISRDVVFNESLMYKDTLKGAGAADFEKEVEFEVELQVRDRAKRITSIPGRYRDEGNVSLSRPSGSRAINSFEKYEWVRAIEEEMSSLKKNHTWELVDQPPGQKLVSYKWLYKIKEGIEGVQKPRVILLLTTCEDYELEQLDVKIAFLHGNLKETIYMRQPLAFEERTGNKVSMGSAAAAMIAVFTSRSLHQFDIKELGPAKKILGMEIIRDKGSRTLKVSQSGYVQKILNNYRVDNGKLVSVPLGAHFKVTANVGLVYGKDQGKYVDVDSFVDADYAKDPYKAEYIALTKAVKEGIWLTGLLIELGVNLRLVVLNCDNQSAIHRSRNAMFHEKTKHINVRYHFIREIVESTDNVVDAFTKVVLGPKFKYCMEILGFGAN
ncbi:retrovirus-related pol polyprotein from transposon TNT 1-94 [Tanacetum coccineum]